jgi:hypothetical protein
MEKNGDKNNRIVRKERTKLKNHREHKEKT